MKKFGKVLVVMMVLLGAAKAEAQIKFDSVGLGQHYQKVMSFMDEDHSFRVEEIDTLTYRMVMFYDPIDDMTVGLFFEKENMTLVRIHMEEPHHLKGKQEHRLMVTNMEIWAEELHANEILECYVEGKTYIEEIHDVEDDGVHTVKIQFPFGERRMIVDVYMN